MKDELDSAALTLRHAASHLYASYGKAENAACCMLLDYSMDCKMSAFDIEHSRWLDEQLRHLAVSGLVQ